MAIHELAEVEKQKNIKALEDYFRTFPQVDFPVEHHFAPGIYSRTMKALKGTMAIGKRHRYAILNIITKGHILLYAGAGEPVKEVTAPYTFVAEPNTRKIAVFLEDTEWINIHPTDKTDLQDIEKEFIIPEEEYVSLLGGDNQRGIEGPEGGRLCHG